MTNLKAKVVAHTQSVDKTLTDANELIAFIARVSNPDNQHNNLSAPKLIDYLQKHKHWSPFEHYSLTIEIECPKDIAVQILRHRSFKFQEFSQRYADVTMASNPDFDVEKLEKLKNCALIALSCKVARATISKTISKAISNNHRKTTKRLTHTRSK